ncbi:hypothetical protein ACJWDT_17170 [Enterobacter hormaechei]|uniref:hypothetical protein n=1 Tax=Enterobacter hormaechei TaxID=158836 RepID=UPI003DA39860
MKTLLTSGCTNQRGAGHLLAVKIKDGEKSGHGSYRQHKRNFMERAFITVH